MSPGYLNMSAQSVQEPILDKKSESDSWDVDRHDIIVKTRIAQQNGLRGAWKVTQIPSIVGRRKELVNRKADTAQEEV